MANEVLIAHTGQRLRVEFSQLTSLDEFKTVVSRQANIPVDCIIALTPEGKPLRLAALQIEKEIYVYDARTAQTNEAGSAATAHLEIPLPKRPSISSPPNGLRDQRSLFAWQELFEARQKWTAALADDCAAKSADAQERYAEMDAIMRCLDAAVANLEAVVRGVEMKYADAKKWVSTAQADHSDLVVHWEQYLNLARSISISPAMLQFMTGLGDGALSSAAKGKHTKQQQQHATLEDLVDLETARKAGKLASAALRRFNVRAADLDRTAPRLLQGCQDILAGFERTVDRSALSHEGESVQLLQDIKAVAEKIGTDYQSILDFSDTPRDVLRASKIAATHTERLLPSIKNRAAEMDDMHRYATQSRNSLARESVDFMRTITELTSLSSDIKAQIAAVGGEEEDMAHFDYLRLVQQIPFVYASFVGEAIKRREWLDKVKTDSSTLANEMALFHDEEVKRRKKWQKSVANLAYGPTSTSAENKVAGLEINLLGEEAEWPPVVRKDLEEFYSELQRQKADADLVDDIGKMLTEIHAPTKQQAKRIKGFKNGSVHEAALGRSGLLIRGDDDVFRSLQDDKSRLENKLKTAESRVRRLEDLLHRQGQASRVSLGGIFQATMPSQQLSERMESTASVKPGAPRLPTDRRTSLDSGAGMAGGESRMAQRIQHLEADLAAERERSEALGRDLETRTLEKTDILTRMDETNSTKNDLLRNLEALKREFTDERKSLEGEIKRLQARLEYTEDEMEARENERASYDDKVHALETEVERLNRESRDDVLKTQGQVEFLRKETKLQREQNEALQKQLQTAQEKVQATAKQLQAANAAADMHVQGFRQLHEQLFAAASDKNKKPVPPTDVADLIEVVSGQLADTLGRVQTSAADMAVVRADLERAEAANKGLRDETAASKEALAGEEGASRRLRENLAEEKARVATLGEELAECRGELGQLRSRMAEGETGSDALRRKLEEAEQKVQALGEEVSAKQSHLGSVEEELRLFRERHREAQAALATLGSRFEARTLRTKDLSQRLYTQNDRLCRLLERLGFSVSREGGSSSSGGGGGGGGSESTSMVIQRVPRAERSALLSSDGAGASSLLRRSSGQLLPLSPAARESPTAAEGTGTAVTPAATAAPELAAADLELLFWMDSADAETEAAKYSEYMATMGGFDIDAVAETVVRRVKEVEHVARKLQRDVRSYREKAHTLQKEAHDKIAFRNFKEGDLALFLPTRNQTNGAWAAFNIGFPHYFLREQEVHRLQKREWLVARITRVQEKVVDLSKSLAQQQQAQQAQQAAEIGSLGTEDNENPFDLSDGLRWYLIDAQEDKPGAPSTPGLGKSTVAANNVEAVADMHTHARTGSAAGRSLGLGLVGGGGSGSGSRGGGSGIDGVSRTLSRSLESRRSSTSSRRASPLAAGQQQQQAVGGASTAAAVLRNTAAAVVAAAATAAGSTGSETNSLRAAAAAASDNNTPEHAGSPVPVVAVTAAGADGDTDGAAPLASEHTLAKLLQRETSAGSSQSRRSVVWDALWTTEHSDEGRRK